MNKPGYRDQGKKRKNGVKHGFAINPEQMDFERRKLLEEMSTKVDKKRLNNGFSLPVSHSWRKKD